MCVLLYVFHLQQSIFKEYDSVKDTVLFSADSPELQPPQPTISILTIQPQEARSLDHYFTSYTGIRTASSCSQRQISMAALRSLGSSVAAYSFHGGSRVSLNTVEELVVTFFLCFTGEYDGIQCKAAFSDQRSFEGDWHRDLYFSGI